MNQHIGQYFLRHVFQNHLHAYLPAGVVKRKLKNDEEPTPTAAYYRTHNPYCDKQRWLRYTFFHSHTGERGGSVVECRTPVREVRGSRPTAAVLCPWARHFTPRKYWLITQEAMAPSRHDWKIVDWDVKPQLNQPTIPMQVKAFSVTYTRCDDATMHVFLDAMNQRDWMFTLYAIKPFFHTIRSVCV